MSINLCLIKDFNQILQYENLQTIAADSDLVC